MTKMTPVPAFRPVLRQSLVALAITATLAGCATAPVPTLQREGRLDGPVAGTSSANTTNGVTTAPLDAPDVDAAPRAQIRRGTGEVINRRIASAPPSNLGGSSGEARFNFEGESLQGVVKAILGDMLGQNYVIAPGVQGTVTLGTPKPVSPAEALNLLDMVLGWNNARMVYSGGRYNIVPADQAIAGTVAPRTGPASTARGFEARTVPLKFVSATEMEKILKPYARPNAIVTVDNSRNVITVAGTRTELENYLRTIETFDVDWLSGMSVGVFPLQSGRASRVVADLERVFGEQSKSPVAGMFRFMPLEGANAVLVITPQADYLDDIQQWLERIDGAGGDARLFAYELKYIKAKDLADRLSEVFGGGRGGSGDTGGRPTLMPGVDSVELRDTDDGATASIGGVDAGMAGGAGTGGNGMASTLSLDPRSGGNGSVNLGVDGQRVGVSAVDEAKSFLVRATPRAWKSNRDVIRRLDVMPVQCTLRA